MWHSPLIKEQQNRLHLALIPHPSFLLLFSLESLYREKCHFKL